MKMTGERGNQDDMLPHDVVGIVQFKPIFRNVTLTLHLVIRDL
jgi:hypothetical protein